MTNENSTLFDIDAGILLAKLHAAAKDQVKTDNGMFIVNTGIENPDDGIKPENLGNTTFNLENKSGEYYLGIANLISYQLPIDITLNQNLPKLYDELKKATKKEQDADQNKSLTDKSENKKSEVVEVQKKIIKEYNTIVNGFKVKEFKVSEADIENKKVKFGDAKKQFDDNIKKENESRKTEFQKVIQTAQNDGFNSIKTYFTVFSGAQNASKINKNQIKATLIDADGNIKTSKDFQPNVKNFQIQTKQLQSKISKYDKDIQKKDPNKFVQRHIMLVVGYEVEL